LTCAACGAFFSARKDSKTCSSKCRKRLSRQKKDVTLFKPNK
jgi:predicted nucleic acid-binding Zn ribbon protein